MDLEDCWATTKSFPNFAGFTVLEGHQAGKLPQIPIPANSGKTKQKQKTRSPRVGVFGHWYLRGTWARLASAEAKTEIWASTWALLLPFQPSVPRSVVSRVTNTFSFCCAFQHPHFTNRLLSFFPQPSLGPGLFLRLSSALGLNEFYSCWNENAGEESVNVTFQRERW